MKWIFTILALVVLALGGWFSSNFLQKELDKNRSAISVLPQECGVIIEGKNLSNTWHSLSESNLVLTDIAGLKEIKPLSAKIKAVDSIISLDKNIASIVNSKELALGLYDHDGAQFVLTMNMSQTEFSKVQTHLKQYLNLNVKDKIRYVEPFIIVGSHKYGIEKVKQHIENQKSLFDLEGFAIIYDQQRTSQAKAKIFVQSKTAIQLLRNHVQTWVTSSVLNNDALPNWFGLELTSNAHKIQLSGISDQAKDNPIFNLISKQSSGTPSIVSDLPIELNDVYRIEISDPSSYVESVNKVNLEEVASFCDCEALGTFSDWIEDEISYVESSWGDMIFVKSSFPNLHGKLTSFGISDTASKTVLDIPVFELNNDYALRMLGHYDLENVKWKFAQIEGLAVFGVGTSVEKYIAEWSEYRNLVKDSKFAFFNKNLMAQQSSLDWFSFVDHLNDYGQKVFTPDSWKKINSVLDKTESFNAVSYQVSKAHNDQLYHAFNLNSKQGISNQNSEQSTLWNLVLENNIVYGPQIMKNHRIKSKDIIVQDDKHILHLIGANGKLKWSKNLNEPIIGEVVQIDILANNKFQMLFNTTNKMHVVDINGNYVSGFPVVLPVAASSPVAALDYENNKNYRFVYADMENNILNIDKTGKRVEGWIAQPAKSLIQSSFSHFTVGGKDYIMNTDIMGNIYLLNRKGEIRYSVDTTINAVDVSKIAFKQGFSIETSSFTYQSKENVLTQLYLDGSIKNIELDSTSDASMKFVTDVDNDKLFEYFYVSDYRLNVYGPDKTLSFSEIFDKSILQKVFIVGEGRKYTFVHDSDANLLYGFSSRFEKLPSFPLFSASKVTIGDINEDKSIDMIHVTKPNTIQAISIAVGGML